MIWNPCNHVVFPMDRDHGSQVMALACEHGSALIHEPIAFLGLGSFRRNEPRKIRGYECGVDDGDLPIVNRLTANDAAVLEASGVLLPIVARCVDDLMLSGLILAVQLLVRGVSPGQH